MKSKLNFTRTTTDKLTIKGGLLSEDCSYITYTDEFDVEQDVMVSDLLESFKNTVIDFSISLKSDEELDILVKEEDDSDE